MMLEAEKSAAWGAIPGSNWWRGRHPQLTRGFLIKNKEITWRPPASLPPAVAAEYYGNLSATRRFAALMQQIFRNPVVVEAVSSQGWADQEFLEAMLAEVRSWAERRDGFIAWMYCAVMGRIGETTMKEGWQRITTTILSGGPDDS